MLTVTLYTRSGCHLCETAKADLQSLQAEIPHRLVEIDIDSQPDFQRQYALEIPVIQAGPYTLKAPFDRQKLRMTLGAAQDRKAQLEKVGDPAYQRRVERGGRLTKADRFSMWFSNHYLWVFNILVFLYVGLPFLAPVLYRAGAEFPAQAIYKVYGGLCHQLSYRSFFLFGEQIVYPREKAGLEGLMTFQEATGLDESGLIAARNFIGNEVVGYKVALCERDVAIYGGILIFGLLFGLTGRRWKSLHILLWLLIGLLPIAVDGLSQLIGEMFRQPGLEFLDFLTNIVPDRESTPFLRTLTGFLFGFTTAWFGYPLVEETMQDARRLLAVKFARVTQPDE
ncbi:MAG: DUF2085 domain-containing protein [Anaerolineales bacterium]|nr:DUF2085 domain-containing protein [Anaerolineales bacterium]